MTGARWKSSPRRPPDADPAEEQYVIFPGLAEVPEAQAVNIPNRSYSIGALVDLPTGARPSGVLFAHGSRFGGHCLYLKDNRLRYVYNFVGSAEQRLIASEDLPAGKNLILSASFDKDGEDPPGVATGVLSLYYGDKKVGEAPDQDPARQVLYCRRGLVRRPGQRRGRDR